MKFLFSVGVALLFLTGSANAAAIAPELKSLSSELEVNSVIKAYETGIKELQRAMPSISASVVTPSRGTDLLQRKLYGTRLINEYKRLEAQAHSQGVAFTTPAKISRTRVSSTPSGYSSTIVRTPSVSRSPSSNNFSGMSSPSVPFKLFPSTPSKVELQTMEIERLKNAAISMQQQLEELQKASSDSTSTSGHDTTTAISVPSTQDRELNRVFNGNRTMVEAYKAAAENGNLDGFWSVVKAEIIQKLTECINKIQPGDANADLLIQPTWVFVEHAAKKGEFLSKVAGAINNLDLSAIPMPSNSSGPMALHNNYMQKINAALWALIDTIVPGKDDSIVLHGSIDPSRMETNQSPRTKLAFRNVLLSAIR